MASRIGRRPPAFLTDDPGAWSIVAQVQREIGGRMNAHHRRHVPVPGLVPLPQRAVPIARSGLAADERLPVGVGRLRVAAALPDPVDVLRFSDEGRTLHGESPRAVRSWTLPSVAPGPVEVRDRAPLPPPPDLSALAGDLAGHRIPTPAPDVVGVIVRDGRLPALALVRERGPGPADRELVRWITGVAAAAWSPDGRVLALGGDWGLLLALEG